MRGHGAAEGRPPGRDRVDHAIGSLRKPLTDAQLEAKFDGARRRRCSATPRAREITAQWRTLASLADVRTLTALCRP